MRLKNWAPKTCLFTLPRGWLVVDSSQVRASCAPALAATQPPASPPPPPPRSAILHAQRERAPMPRFAPVQRPSGSLSLTRWGESIRIFMKIYAKPVCPRGVGNTPVHAITVSQRKELSFQPMNEA